MIQSRPGAYYDSRSQTYKMLLPVLALILHMVKAATIAGFDLWGRADDCVLL